MKWAFLRYYDKHTNIEDHDKLQCGERKHASYKEA